MDESGSISNKIWIDQQSVLINYVEVVCIEIYSTHSVTAERFTRTKKNQIYMQVATVSTLISWKKIFANATAYIKEQST